MSAIDRVLYYDGEFLRAFDFQDEQAYHREMRRRINRYLHLYGIVRGLQLNDDVQGSGSTAVHSVSILEGLAIDAFGREIYVFSPYTLGDQDIQANRIPAGVANYDVWLRYNKTPQTPPSSGYNNCNQANQYTRWQEGFSVVLLKHGEKLFTPLEFTDDDSDDPTQDQVGVLLGTVQVDAGSATQQFSIPAAIATPVHDHFWGSIIQRIQTPPGYDARSQFQFTKQQSPRNPPVSLEVYPNIFAGQNMILGPDYDLTQSSGVATTITPAPTTSPGGSLKLAGDLFAAGNVYSFLPGPPPQWLGLQTYVPQLVQQQLPDFVVSPPTAVNLPSPAPSLGSFSDTAQITIPSKLTSMSKVVAAASLSGIQCNTPATMNQVGVFFNSVSAAPGISQCTVSVTYTVTGVPVSLVDPMLSFYITAMAICFP
jgi:hypothetical protein